MVITPQNKKQKKQKSESVLYEVHYPILKGFKHVISVSMMCEIKIKNVFIWIKSTLWRENNIKRKQKKTNQ